MMIMLRDEDSPSRHESLPKKMSYVETRVSSQEMGPDRMLLCNKATLGVFVFKGYHIQQKGIYMCVHIHKYIVNMNHILCNI